MGSANTSGRVSSGMSRVMDWPLALTRVPRKSMILFSSSSNFNRPYFLCSNPGFNARKVQQIADGGDQSVCLLLCPREDVLVIVIPPLFFHLLLHIVQNKGQLLMNGGKRGPELMRDLGHKLGFELIQCLHCRDIHNGQHSSQALFPLSQNRPAPGQKKFAGRQIEFIRGDIVKVHVFPSGDIHHKRAESLVGHEILDPVAWADIVWKVQVLTECGIYQHHLALGIGDENPVWQRFHDGVHAALLHVQVCQGSFPLFLEFLGLL